MNNERSRKVLIVSASIGTGHMQAARAIEEYWKEKEPQASITHVDFLDTETMSVEHLIKGTYIKMIDVFPMLYDMIYRVSKGEKRGTIMQTALSYLLKSRMLKLVQQEEPDVMVFTHPFPCGAASILKRQGHIDVPLVAIMTDFSSHQFWLYPQIDTYYVATESMVDEMVAAGIDESRIHVSGIPVRRSFFRDAIEEYSWWSYMGKARERNTGWRIDYFITSKRLDDKIQEAKIHQQIFGSDHCPVELDIDL